jgi:sterol desaturase/sphingolipid hydroxylase (fatty acid hydroxylase superfamily)
MLQLLIIIVCGIFFLTIERLAPGRSLPNSAGWYVRAILLNAFQFSLVFIAGATWNAWFQEFSILHFPFSIHSILAGLIFWFIGTFVFYWWHRLRHANGWWRVFHQIHHSPTRIEALTAFYKHPVEMITNSILISAIIFVLFGGSIEAAAWYNVFAVIGEFFYHMNVRTPVWVGWFIQRPEHHSLHHARGIHQFNFADITLWDRIFGTFKEMKDFAPACGFDQHQETKLIDMLAFHDVQR